MAYSVRVAFLTILRKEIRRFMRIWVQTLIPPAITITLYFLIFGTLIGSRIGGVGDIDYMSFVVPGLIMMAIINNAYSNVASSFFGAKYNGSIEELLVSPMPNSIILLAYMVSGAMRGLLVGLIVTILSIFFTSLTIHSIAIILLVGVLSALLFATAGFLNGMLANSFDDVSIIPTFILTPLTYLGGVFYSITWLSEFWQIISLGNPVLYLVNIFRYGFLGVSDISIWPALMGLCVFWLALIAVILYLMKYSNRLRK